MGWIQLPSWSFSRWRSLFETPWHRFCPELVSNLSVWSFEASEDNYHVKANYHFRFTETPPAYIFLDFIGNPKRDNDEEGSIFGQYPDKVQFSFRSKEGYEAHIADSVEDRTEFKKREGEFCLPGEKNVFYLIPYKYFR